MKQEGIIEIASHPFFVTLFFWESFHDFIGTHSETNEAETLAD